MKSSSTALTAIPAPIVAGATSLKSQPQPPPPSTTKKVSVDLNLNFKSMRLANSGGGPATTTPAKKLDQLTVVDESKTTPFKEKEKETTASNIIGTNEATAPTIRRLGPIEKIYHGPVEPARCYIYRALIVETHIDLYEHLSIIRLAVHEWKKMHALLRCRIVTRNVRATNAVVVKEPHFAFASESRVNSLANVHLLYVKSPDDVAHNCDDIWKLLLERETTMPIDGDDELLWRLTFFRINKPQPQQQQQQPQQQHLKIYAVMLTFDHCIMDGRSSYTSLLQLFSLIEQIHTQRHAYKKLAAVSTRVLPPKEHIFAYRAPGAQAQVQREYVKAPGFLDTKAAASTAYVRLKHLTSREEEASVICSISASSGEHRPLVSLRDLVDIAKRNTSKFRTLVVNKASLARITAKCKQHQVKFTTFLNMALVLAVRMLYDKHGDGDGGKDETKTKPVAAINYTTNVSLREFGEYKRLVQATSASGSEGDADTLGCYVGLSFTRLTEPITFSDHHSAASSERSVEWTRQFWSTANKESAAFHANLVSGEFIHSICLPAKRKEPDEFFFHFGNSNLGVVPSSLAERKLIKVRHAFATGKYDKSNFLCWFSNLVVTIDEQLNWTMSFNANLIRQELISDIIDNLTRIINRLI